MFQLDAPMCISRLDIVSKNSGSSEKQSSGSPTNMQQIFLRMHVDVVTIGYCLVTVVLNYMLWYCKVHRGLLCFIFVGEKEKENIVCVFLKPFSKQAVEHVQSHLSKKQVTSTLFQVR